MKIRDLKIKTRLALGFSIILISLIIIGFFSLRNLEHVTETTQNIYNHPLIVSNTVRDIKSNVIAIHRSMKDVALAENELEMKQAKLLVDKYESTVFEKFQIVLDKFLGDKQDVEKAHKSFSDWKLIREEVILLWENGQKEEAIAITKGKGARHVEKVLEDVEVMIKFAEHKANEFYGEILTKEKGSYNTMILILSISLVLFLYIIFTLSKSILTPIKMLNQTAQKIESGNLDARNTIDAKDELNTLALSFNHMTDSIKSRTVILSGLTEISTTLHGISEKEAFSKALLSTFMKLCQAQFAVFYILDTASETFIPFDAIGANRNNLQTFNASNPPGDLGNIIHKNDVHILKNLNDINYFKYESVIGSLLMSEIATTPILDSEKVISFITCGSVDTFSENEVEIFRQSVPIISASYTTLIANQKTKEYSEQLARTNEELELQSEELKATGESLQKQNIKLDNQRKEVEEANRLKSEFLSNMSHELRTPLNSINALSKVLIIETSGKLNEDENNYLEIIERNGKKLLSLINDILDLSKIEAGKLELNPTRFSVNNFLSLIVENIKPLADAKGLQLNLEIKDRIEVTSDKNKLDQVITNVVGNAIKFTQKGEINVTCEQNSGYISIKIKDTGIGISEEQLPFIFHEFRQADGSTSRPYEGTGLGLAITQKIISELKGYITCKSKIGVGSTFTITIPGHWNTQNSTNSPVITETANTQQKTILVVDDDLGFIDELSENLREEGYTIVKTTSSRDVVNLAAKHKPVAITLDIVMPEMDGWEALLRLKKNKATSDIPIIIISNSDEEDTSIALGAVGYIQKPVEKEILLKEIRNINQTAANILIVDDNPVDILHMKDTLKNEDLLISSCTSGEECLQFLENKNPDILLLDLMMPDMDGFSVLKEIRQKETLQHLPVIIVTAKDLSKQEKQFLNERASSIVSKNTNTGNSIIHEIRGILEKLENKHVVVSISTLPNILLFEDNETTNIQIRKILEEEGIKVNHVNNEKQGLAYLKTTIPDIIIFDLRISGINGVEMLQNIRENNYTHNIPVLILTAKSLNLEENQKLGKYNKLHLMQKDDIDANELMQKIKLLLEDRPEELLAEEDAKKAIEIDNLSGNIKGKIVLIEDNPDNRVTIKAIIGDKHKVFEAINGEEGLTVIKEEKPDLVLLDISLPKLDGFGVIKQIRNDKNISKIPVIAVTAKAMKEDQKRILEAGCNDYVAKPINNEELQLKIEKYIS